MLCEDSLSLKSFRSWYFTKTANKMKIKGHSKNSTYHVKRQKLRLNGNWLIVVEEERWDANRGIPKLRCLRLLEILIRYALGIPKLEILCLLNSLYITVSLNLKNFIHIKTWQELVRYVSINPLKTLTFSTIENH